MTHIVRLFLLTLVAQIIVGCQTGGGVREVNYPAEIRGIGDSPNYPLSVAGFERAEIMTYAPGMTNISTAYNLLSSQLQIAATIYEYHKPADGLSLPSQFKAEQANIEKYHPGARLLSEEPIILEKSGKKYSAQRAAYEFNGEFMHKRQTLYSELYLVAVGKRYVKLRSTAPSSQRLTAAAKNLELMQAVNWAHEP